MDDVKPWQIVIMVLAVIALGFVVVKYGFGGGSPESKMNSSMTLVDVETGQLYTFDISGKNGIVIPARNPESNKKALLPVYKNDDSEWAISNRYRTLLDSMEVPTDAVAGNDAKVQVLDNSPIELKRKRKP
ncbi:MAG: hypothetical protein JKY96_05640 [Phycisphaerales bacterium]|nr:hypothetical protein [Phycisphaerales bacterium]